MNKNSISVVAIYSLVAAAFSGLASSFIDGEFIWTSFLKTTAITWVLATIHGYILYLLVYPKNVQPSTQPSTASSNLTRANITTATINTIIKLITII